MKKRIQIDSAILSFAIILTGFLYLNRDLYAMNRLLDDVLDFAGMMIILKGVLFRMAARGHKKKYSRQGGQLVTDGPYRLVRNPMYFGSFLLGAGFTLIVWPWWGLPVFAVLFYLRFNRQIVKEEEYLSKAFGEEFAAYCRTTPRLFPSVSKIMVAKTSEIFDLKEAFSTKEKRGLWGWPILAVALELFQETLVFGHADLRRTAAVFLSAVIVFFAGLWIFYRGK